MSRNRKWDDIVLDAQIEEETAIVGTASVAASERIACIERIERKSVRR
jgi:hypothetical protein